MSSHSDFVPSPNSFDLIRLVETQLEEAHQGPPIQPAKTLDDPKLMVQQLSEITNICVDYVNNAEEKPAAKAFQEMEYGFTWREFLQAVQTGDSPSAPTYLFRAAKQAIPSIQSQWSFNQFRRDNSVDDFVSSLGRHLGKVRDLIQPGEKELEEHMTSMSPNLEWTLHTTGQRWKPNPPNDSVGLFIYDLQALRHESDGGVFRVANIIKFLKDQNKTHNIDEELQEWAENCDEYITVGIGFHTGLVRFVLWEDLCKMPIVSNTFCKAFHLGKYRCWRDEKWSSCVEVAKSDVCMQVLESAKTIAGTGQQDIGRVREILRLILLPGIWFWNIKTNTTKEEALEECERLLEPDLTSRFRQITIGN